jgi:Domain of unknown function (DUF4124)
MRNVKLWTAPQVRRLGVLILLSSAATIASAQWAWRDEHGRTVYSDEPPPAGIKPTEVFRQPEPTSANPDSTGASAQPQSSPAPASAAPKAATEAPRPPTMAERELEFRKRMKDRADAEKKLADGQAEASRKTEDCERARGYLKSIESGVRLVHTNPDGSRELLDEAQRAAEAQRTQEVIESRCSP